MEVDFDPACLSNLLKDPGSSFKGEFAGVGYTAKVAIPNYGDRIASHYKCDIETLSPVFEFPHFGIVIEFEDPIEIALHDSEMKLQDGMRTLLDCYGTVVLRNAFQPQCDRSSDQRNVFSSLRFHVDRGETQQDHYSLFWRDPFDAVQRMPRSSSTLVLPYAVARLQASAEGQACEEFKFLYHLFQETDPQSLFGDVVLEVPWRAPEGVGEIAMLDNRRVLHASYYDSVGQKGYPISVRYLF